VDYDLTALGRSMLAVRALGAWAQAHIPRTDAARARYDGKGEG
jgi:DNA-binding HxlR family transcriptional regulator